MTNDHCSLSGFIDDAQMSYTLAVIYKLIFYMFMLYSDKYGIRWILIAL